MNQFISSCIGRYLYVLALCALFCGTPVRAATVTWTATGTNDWSNTSNWSSFSVPAAGDEVIINYTNVGVLLTNSTAALSSILLSNKCTLIFSNWDTALTVSNLTVLSNGIITCAGPFTNTVMSNRVYIICTNLTVTAGGSINVDGLGYTPETGPGRGVSGGGDAYRGGGGYGGRGGYGQYIPTSDNYGRPYGDVSAPLDPGSGGGKGGAAGTNVPGAGGGVVYVNAVGGVVTLNGIVSANGGNNGGAGTGGGSGGAIYITCQTFAGTNGILRARGGTGNPSSGGGGGGGRIAVAYDASLQSNQVIPQVSYLANGGAGYDTGDIGTVYFPSASVMTNVLTTNMVGQLFGFSSWAVDSLIVTGAWVRFANEGFSLTVTNDVTISGSTSRVDVGGGGIWPVYQAAQRDRYLYSSQTNGSSVAIGGHLLLTNSARLYVYSALTNNIGADYGALINVTSNIVMDTNTWVYCVSHPTNGVSALFRMNNLIIATNAGINADFAGYSEARGPGKGTSSIRPGGGGYGGAGGQGADGTPGGASYGSSDAPAQPGSGGGSYNALNPGGFGGGLVRIQARGDVALNGTITANGDGPITTTAGGSGGGVYIQCRTFTGANGIVRANGGSVNSLYGGGGGGGRIAVWRMYDSAVGPVITANYGTGYSNGAPGTVVLGQLPVPGTIFTVH